MGNSKKKGGNYDRDEAKFLTKVTGVEWYRVGVSSGARGTTTNNSIEAWVGDVFTDNVHFKDIVIEAKAYSSFKITDFYREKSDFRKWISQSEKESDGKDWALFFKINNQGQYVVTPGYRFCDLFSVDFKTDIVIEIFIDNNHYYLERID